MFLRPAEPNDYKFISAHGIDAQGKSIEVIPLPKHKHQDFSDKFSVAIVLVHDLSRPPSSFVVSVHANSFQAFGSIEEVSHEEIDRREREFRNSFTVLYEKEFRRGEITSVEQPFRPILDKLWKAIKDGDTCFDFNEHVDQEEDQ